MGKLQSKLANRILKFYRRHARVLQLLSLFTMVSLIALFMTPSPKSSYSELQVGDKVWDEIKSNFEFSVVDEVTTEKRQTIAERKVLPVYDYDSSARFTVEQRVTKEFTRWRQLIRERRFQLDRFNEITGPPRPPELETNEPMINSPEELQSLYQQFLETSDIKISKETFEMLVSDGFPVEIERSVRWIIGRVYTYDIVANRNLLIQHAAQGLLRRDVVSGDERNIYNLDIILSIEDAWREIDYLVAQRYPDDEMIQYVVSEVTRAMLLPNLNFNMQETQLRVKNARDTVKPVFFKVSAGEIIAQAGDTVTQEMKARMDQLNRLSRQNRLSLIFLGNILFISMMTWFITVHIRRYHQHILKDPGRLVLIGVIALLQALFIRVFLILVMAMPELVSRYPYSVSKVYLFAVPYAMGAMLMAMLVQVTLGFLFSFIFGLLAAITADMNLEVGIFAMLSSCAAVFAVSQYKQRTMVLQAGFFISLANLSVVIMLQAHTGDLLSMPMIISGMSAVIGGLIVAAIVTVLLPILESAFRIPTDIRLLELSNFNQPLLRKLAMNAPGSHHHSLMVGDLAETAAEVIGANTLLAKVGAYYHDIGKISKPGYFIENNQGKNPHNDLSPSMSAMIIRNHVKEGVEMAKKAGLGRDIINIIEQHHGNSMLAFFYEKAKTQARDGREIPEEDFRYQAPRPKTKEAAIVLIADAVEAAARSLKNPSPSALKSLVQKITLSKFQDNQFDDSDLTFRELTIIADCLFKRLVQNYHSRISYPGFDFEQKITQNNDKEQSDSTNQ